MHLHQSVIKFVFFKAEMRRNMRYFKHDNAEKINFCRFDKVEYKYFCAFFRVRDGNGCENAPLPPDLFFFESYAFKTKQCFESHTISLKQISKNSHARIFIKNSNKKER